MHINVSVFYSLKGLRRNDTPVAINTPSAQIFVTKCHSPLKSELRAEVTDFRGGPGKEQMNL